MPTAAPPCRSPDSPDGAEQYESADVFCQVSINLANPAHIDVDDAGRSHALWLRNLWQQPDPEHWFFLLPDVGLAIRLRHGCCISWDGRAVSHCTSVPGSVADGEMLLSCWCGVSAKMERARRRQEEYENAVHCRQLRGAGQELLAEGSRVWIQSLGRDGKMWRRETAVVTRVDEHAGGGRGPGFWTRLPGKQGTSTQPQFHSFAALSQRIVLAGRIGEAAEEGEALVGKRVRVFWAAQDACFDGEVTAHSEGKHSVLYDDGEEVTHVLGPSSGSYYRTIE